MPALANWTGCIVPQKRPGTGCVPTGYQMLLRAGAVPIKDESTFQDRYDLDKDLKLEDVRSGRARPQNNFESVRQRVVAEHPGTDFEIKHHKTGIDKVRFLEEQIGKGIPTIVSVLVKDTGAHRGFHIYLAVEDTGDCVVLADGSGAPPKPFRKDDIVRWHDAHPGFGDDTVHLVK